MSTKKEREKRERRELERQEAKLAQLKNYTQKQLAKQFSGFIQWNKPNISTKLNLNLLERVIASIQENNFTTEQELANFWFGDWQRSVQSYTAKDFKNRYRPNHPLEAYLQLKCFWVARKLYWQYKSNSSLKSFEISDYFNIGYLQLEKILSKYEPLLNPSLAAHVSSGFKYKIIDELRRINSQSGKSKNYLLVKATTKRFEDALNAYAISSQLVESYTYVWEYYKEIYQETYLQGERKRYPAPDLQILERIVRAVNMSNPPQLLQDAEQLNDWMNECSEAIINYNNIQTESYDRPLNEENESNYLDLLAAEKELTENSAEQIERSEHSTQLINKFRGQLIIELEAVIAEDNKRVEQGKKRKLLDNFDLILELHHGLGINETKIAAYMNYFYLQQEERKILQCTLNRKLNNIISGKDMLGDRLLYWMNNNPEYKIYLDNYAFVRSVFNESLKSVLQYYYKSLDWQRYSWLESEMSALSSSQQELIEIYYARYTEEYAINSISRISTDLSQNVTMLQEELIEIKNLLLGKFINLTLPQIDVQSFQADSILMNQYLYGADANRKNNQRSQVTLQEILYEIIDSLLENYCKNIRIKIEEEIKTYKVQSPNLDKIQQWLAESISNLESSQKTVLRAWYGYDEHMTNGLNFALNDLVAAKEILANKLIESSKSLDINLNVYDISLAKYENNTKKIKTLQKEKASRYIDNFLFNYYANQQL